MIAKSEAEFNLEPGVNNVTVDVPVHWSIETRGGIKMRFPIAARTQVTFDMPADGGDFAKIEIDIPENATLGAPLRVVK